MSVSSWDTLRGLSGRKMSLDAAVAWAGISSTTGRASGVAAVVCAAPGAGCSLSRAEGRDGEGAARGGLGVRDPGGWEAADAGMSSAYLKEVYQKRLREKTKPCNSKQKGLTRNRQWEDLSFGVGASRPFSCSSCSSWRWCRVHRQE